MYTPREIFILLFPGERITYEGEGHLEVQEKKAGFLAPKYSFRFYTKQTARIVAGDRHVYIDTGRTFRSEVKIQTNELIIFSLTTAIFIFFSLNMFPLLIGSFLYYLRYVRGLFSGNSGNGLIPHAYLIDKNYIVDWRTSPEVSFQASVPAGSTYFLSQYLAKNYSRIPGFPPVYTSLPEIVRLNSNFGIDLYIVLRSGNSRIVGNSAFGNLANFTGTAVIITAGLGILFMLYIFIKLSSQ